MANTLTSRATDERTSVPPRQLERDGVVVLLPTGRTPKETDKLDVQNARALLWLAGFVGR